MKEKWSVKIPEKDGWYWCRWHSRKYGGWQITPALVTTLGQMGKYKNIRGVDVFNGGWFSNETRARQGWLSAEFGPEIQEPKT